ncbi:MAG: transglycosylase domain-containing protein [Proteobacteria bacterium]|nr:transglycosylase domain-containing protein [Pseudomonadota bacterium]MCP4918477.1 transglycosylase domain-containing protein [Pseudomonadota bacterium]
MKQRLVVGLIALVVLALAGVEGAWQLAFSRAEDAGVRWVDFDWGLLSRTLHGVDRGPVSAERVVIGRQEIVVHGARVELGGAAGGSGGGSGDTDALAEVPVPIRIDSLDVVYDDQVLVSLSGSMIRGEGSLDGDGASVQIPGPLGQKAVAELDVPVEHEHLSGTLRVAATWAEPPELALSSDDLVVEHPLLSTRAVALPRFEAALAGDPGQLEGTFLLGELEGLLTIERGDELRVAVELQQQSADAAFRVFEDIVPELRWAHVAGIVEGTASYSHPSGEWTLDPYVRDLAVSGAVNNLGELRGGVFTYAVRDADGDPVPRQTGEGTRDWVAQHQVSPHMFAAIVAAEDSAFFDHAGYSEESIREALVANIEAGGVARGGSTLTQQLAKNLYLDGERTLERKLRELLIAVELDRALGKSRILTLYVNVVEWGPEMWGLSQASDRYFLRKPETIPPNEAAFLAAILPNPREMYTDWYLRDRASGVRIDWILQNMADGGHFSDGDARMWAEKPLIFVPPPR